MHTRYYRILYISRWFGRFLQLQILSNSQSPKSLQLLLSPYWSITSHINSLKSDAIASSFDSFITPIVSYNKFSNFSNTIRGNHINTGRFRQYSLYWPTLTCWSSPAGLRKLVIRGSSACCRLARWIESYFRPLASLLHLVEFTFGQCFKNVFEQILVREAIP